MKQLKSSREYWRSVITNWQKRYLCKWKGRGKFANLFRFWSNSHFSQNPDWTNFKICPAAYFILELVIETSSLHWATQNWKSFARKIVILCVGVHFFSKSYSWHFFGTLEYPFLQFQIVTVAPIWIRGTLDRGQRITIAHWGEEGAKWWSYKKCRNTVGKCESLREKKTFPLSLGFRFCQI